MAKRIILFVALNFLVVCSFTVICTVLGVNNYISEVGLNVWLLGVFCLIWGMGCSLFSLSISRAVAKWLYKIRLVNKLESDPKAKALVDIVYEMSRKAKLPEMPEVGIYESSDLNAFATGPTKSRSLVAVSSGLLDRFDREELSGVIGHEVAHIANGDMVTMALLQGVVNAFAMFLARVIAYAVAFGDDEDSLKGRLAYFLIVWVLQTVFLILGSILVCWFSRHREYRADAGGAELAGREQMAKALTALRNYTDEMAAAKKRGQPLEAMMISGADGGLLQLWSTHPPLDQRIQRLYGSDESGAAAALKGDLPERDSGRSSNSLRDSFGKKDRRI